MAKSLLILLALVLSDVLARNEKMKEIFSWKKIDFKFPTEKAREEALKNNDFVPENNLPLGLDVWKDKLFVTLPRWKSGVPATLTYVPLGGDDHSPALIPYPDWETNSLSTENADNQTKIVSTFRVRVDPCDRLWVMDTGVADLLGSHVRVGPHQILIYDLNTNKLLHKYSLKDSDKKENSFFANIIVDVEKDSCGSAYAYIPDLGGYGVVVYSLEDNDSWRISHNFFHFDPLSGDLNVGGVNFQWNDGVFSLALSPKQEDGYKTAYFHALASTRQFSVSTKFLQNATLASNSYHEFKDLGSRGPNTQSTASFLDPKSKVLFYTQLNRNGVACWNSTKPFSADNQGLVTTDEDTFIFPNDLKVDYDGRLWVLTDRLPSFIYKSLNYDDVNYRIFSASVEHAIKDTQCA